MVGLHGLETNFYNGTVIPLTNENKLHNDCKLHHQSNKYCNLESSDWLFILDTTSVLKLNS